MAAAAIFGFFKFYIFNGQEGRTASLCRISSKSLEPRPKYGDFYIFKDGGRRHIGFCEILNV